ncbi:MAG: hypothetical protein M3Y56_05475 [Armatimonadota bacterium]|nr:hypothetical protein [Armatimonadota bacterium]
MPETLTIPYLEAKTIVEDQVLDYLLVHKDPAKTTDLIPAVAVAAVTPRVIREILEHSLKFVSVNRKWDLAIRHATGAVTVERAVNSILLANGRPANVQLIASELSIITGRPAEVYEPTLPRFLASRPQYASLGNGTWAWQEWLLNLKLGYTEDDVLFENFFMSSLEEELEALKSAAEKFPWNREDLADSALRFINERDESISNRVLTYFAWKAAPEKFSPTVFFDELRSLPGTLLLSGCRWCPVSLKRQFEKVYQELGQREEEAVPADDVVMPLQPEQPLELDADDVEQVFKIVLGSDRSWRVPELVETAFDLTEGDRGYEEYVQQLNLMLVDDERFLWVGTDRWREAGTLPEFVFDVPEQLTIEQYIFEDENQETIDVELDDRGIDEGLLQAMSSLLVQDFGDRETDVEGAGEEIESTEIPLLRHHRETGTLPVLPAFRGLFPPSPDIIELMVTTNTGQRFPLWLNDTLETLFGAGRWFVEADLPMSGTLLRLSKTHVPGEYRLEATGDMEPRLAIDEDRMDELEMLKLEAEGENPLPTFDILRRVMESYGQKGASFVHIWAEANIVRRSTRRMVASILSAYQCFVPIARGGDVWWYDEKRLPLGINKQKRKYIRNAQ